jgi:hypothetical protein
MLIQAQKIVPPQMRARISNPSEMGQVHKTMILPKRARVRNPDKLTLAQKTMIHHRRHKSAPRLALSSAHCGICLQGSFIVLEEDITGLSQLI